MSVSLDSSVNALVGQSQAMAQSTLKASFGVQLLKSATEMQESAVMTLIDSAGLATYNSSGQMQISTPAGAHVQVDA